MQDRTTLTRRWFVIANPVAGGGRVGQQWPALQSWLQTHLPNAEIACTQARGHAISLARSAIKAGHRHLLAIGGDGTANEVANAILEQQTVESRSVTLALLPIGTGNDWIRSYGIPRRRDRWLQMLADGNCLIQDAGRLEYFDTGGIPRSRYFLNVVGIGFDASVVKHLQEQPLPRWIRQAYLLAILRHLMTYRSTPGRICFDQQEWEGRFITLEAGIGRFVGGGLQLLPHARPADGQLAVTLARHTSKLDILANIWRFFDGSIGRHSKIDLRKVTHLSAEPLSAQPLLVEADGEYLGRAPARISLLPNSLKIITYNE